MGRKLGLTRDDVIAAAAAMADADGLDRLELTRVAERLGVRPPSLYHHVAGKEGLRRAIAAYGAARLNEAITSAVRGRHGREALVAVGRAYRTFARRHPGQLAATLPAPTREEDAALYDALAAPVATLVAILADLGITGNDAIHAIRALRSYLHGFADLERRGGFGMPQKIDRSFERGLALFVAGLGA